MLPVMLPLLTSSLRIGHVQAGLVISAYQVTASLAQPLFGYMGDRFRYRLVGCAGILWVASFIILAAYTSDYLQLIVCATLAGLGSAAYHPPAATRASSMDEGSKASTLALFLMAGMVGYALGPLIGGNLFAATGLRGTLVLIIPALLVAPLFLRLSDSRKADMASPIEMATDRPASVASILALVLVLLLRYWTYNSLFAFIPLLYQERGYSVAVSGQILFWLTLAQGGGALVGGVLSDRFGHQRFLTSALFACVPCLFAFLSVSYPASAFGAIVLGIVSGTTHPVIVFLAQRSLPGLRGTATGLALSLPFVAGAIGTTVTGAIADGLDLTKAVNSLLIVGLLAAAVSLALLKANGRQKKHSSR